jgi:hypothetical protein
VIGWAAVWVVLASDPDLDQAAEAVEQGQFDAVPSALARARSHPLAVEDQARACELEAFTAAAFDDVFAERRAFDALLELRPDYVLPRQAGPKMQAIFLEAQRARRPAELGSPPRLHLSALLLVELTNPRAVGGDVSATFRVLPFLDLGAGASIGRAPGPELVAELHLPELRVSPFLQLRGLVCWPSGQVVWGAGAWVGVAVGLGPGRVQAGAAGELYRAPQGFPAEALLAVLGYVLDPGALLR